MKTKQILQIIITLLVFSVFNNVFAQNSSWKSQIGSSSWDWGRGITDKVGNFFIFGNFQGTWCYLNNDTLVNNGQNSLLFAKYDLNGNELWAQRLGGDNSSYGANLQGGLIYYDSITDYIFVAGHFWGTALFGSFQLTAQASDIFLAKYDHDGTCIWLKVMVGLDMMIVPELHLINQETYICAGLQIMLLILIQFLFNQEDSWQNLINLEIAFGQSMK
jgi:hypothetical protein